MDVVEEEADTWEVEVRHFVSSCFFLFLLQEF